MQRLFPAAALSFVESDVAIFRNAMLIKIGWILDSRFLTTKEMSHETLAIL